jgi:hypothetical protein
MSCRTHPTNQHFAAAHATAPAARRGTAGTVRHDVNDAAPGHNVVVHLPQLRSPLARAVVPVLAGATLIAVIGLFTWGVASFIARSDASTSERLAPSTIPLGNVESVAEEIRERGPLLIPGLNTTTGERSLVVNHAGSIDSQGWEVYWAYPADRDGSCLIESVRGTSTFTDCDGRIIDVTDLAPPTDGVRPIVENQRTLILDLHAVTDTSVTSNID